MTGSKRINRSRKRKKTTIPHQSPTAVADAAEEPSPPPEEEEEEEEEEESEAPERGGEWRDWSSLTSPILLLVLSLLHTLQDLFAFRGVCASWRSLSPPSSLSPLLLLTRAHRRSKALYDPAARRIYRAHLPWDLSTRHTLSYSHGHLITSTPLSSPPYKPLLFNLLTGAQTRLPKTPLPFHRLLLSSPPSSSSCRALLLHPSGSPLQLCRPAATDRLWSVHRFGGSLCIADALFHRGELYALTDSGGLGMVRFSPEEEPEFVIVPGEPVSKVATDMRTKNNKWFLAECGDERLLLVCICFFGGGRYVKIEVRAWDSELGGRWAKVAGLGNKAIFLGSTGFAGWLVGSAGSGVRENCVYCCTNYPRNEWVVYSLEDQVGEIVNGYDDAPDVDRNWAGEHPVWVFPSIC